MLGISAEDSYDSPWLQVRNTRVSESILWNLKLVEAIANYICRYPFRVIWNLPVSPPIAILFGSFFGIRSWKFQVILPRGVQKWVSGLRGPEKGRGVENLKTLYLKWKCFFVEQYVSRIIWVRELRVPVLPKTNGFLSSRRVEPSDFNIPTSYNDRDIKERVEMRKEFADDWICGDAMSFPHIQLHLMDDVNDGSAIWVSDVVHRLVHLMGTRTWTFSVRLDKDSPKHCTDSIASNLDSMESEHYWEAYR